MKLYIVCCKAVVRVGVWWVCYFGVLGGEKMYLDCEILSRNSQLGTKKKITRPLLWGGGRPHDDWKIADRRQGPGECVLQVRSEGMKCSGLSGGSHEYIAKI